MHKNTGHYKHPFVRDSMSPTTLARFTLSESLHTRSRRVCARPGGIYFFGLIYETASLAVHGVQLQFG